MWQCQECGRKSKGIRMSRCPKCGSTDIDLEPVEKAKAVANAGQLDRMDVEERAAEVRAENFEADEQRVKAGYFGEEADPLRPEVPEWPKVTQEAPQYWLNDGGAHWTVTASCGASVSAVRIDRDQRWGVYDCFGGQTTWEKTDDAVCIELLKNLLQRCLRASLDEMEERP